MGKEVDHTIKNIDGILCGYKIEFKKISIKRNGLESQLNFAEFDFYKSWKKELK